MSDAMKDVTSTTYFKPKWTSYHNRIVKAYEAGGSGSKEVKFRTIEDLVSLVFKKG